MNPKTQTGESSNIPPTSTELHQILLEQPTAVLDMLTAHIAILDESGKIVAVNAAWRRFGQNNDLALADAGIGSNYLTICETAAANGDEEAEVMAKAIRDVISNQHDHVQLQYACPGPAGPAWFLAHVTRFEQGEHTWVMIAHEDITSFKQTELAQTTSQEQVRYQAMLVDHLFDAVISTDLDFKVTTFNRAAEQLYGWRVDEVLGRSWNELAKTQYNNTTPQEVRNEFFTQGYWAGQVSQQRRNGQRIMVEARVSLVRDESGQPLGVVAVNRDVTKRMGTEEALRESEARFRNLFERSNDAIIIHVVDGMVLRINRQMELLLGYSQDELTAMSIFIPAEESETWLKAGAELVKKGTATFETRLKRKIGELIPVEISASFIDEQQQVVQAFVRDITERKRAEEEKEKLLSQLHEAQKLEAIGRLAGGVSHDFNNMLTVIIGNAELAKTQFSPNDPLQQSMDTILNAANRSAALTRQLLAFARQQSTTPKDLDLNRYITNSQSTLQRIVGSEIELRLALVDNLWGVRIDPTQVDQILANLALNAREAMDNAGTITIETQNIVLDEAYCHLHSACTPGDYVMIAFKDTGSGIPKEIQAHIFEPFFTTKEAENRVGLGLATVYGIVRQNFGSIDVYSEPGQGALFKIYLPRHQGFGEVVEAQLSKDAWAGTGTVLVVEDELDILLLCRETLEQLGYKVLTAALPEEAIKLCQEYEGDIHLLVTDVVMPVMNGKELKERVEKLKPGIKTLFMSGYGNEVIAHRGVLIGEINYIQKPFDVDDFASRVKEVLA